MLNIVVENETNLIFCENILLILELFQFEESRYFSESNF